MDKTYNPAAIESHWSKFWETQGYATPAGDGKAYTIMLPPPNVTGTLHMGHGFQQTLMDTLVRKQRMAGFNTLWQPGTDHAGIATQMVVERNLGIEGKTRHDLGRDAFVDEVWKWKEQSGSTITRQIRRMGHSLDWTRERFSMDEQTTRATYEAFIRLYNEGLIYRGKKLVNWDPKLNTAISDLEVSTDTESGHLWHIEYPLADASGSLIVATTRPETMLGDTAVAVHPDDERYQAFIGKAIKLPLTDREIPIIADDYVDREFGTGCVKITPAHDFNDYDMGKRHNLPMINILDANAHLNDNVPDKYQGLERFAARKQIVADLETLGVLKQIEDHSHNVPRGTRSGAVIEPYLTDQWFVKMDDMAKQGIDVVNNGKVKFVPANWTKTYLQWLENIQDWCISRQLWWGHRIPVWYDDDNHMYVGHNEAEVRADNKLDNNVNLRQDTDVLDTWFTAALYPFSTLGWPDNTPDMQQFYPGDVLITGFDIIFFWVARMIMLGVKLVGDVPFREVYIHGLIRDSHGKKMSKSKANVLDPIDLIDGIDLDSLVKKRCFGLMQPEMANRIKQLTQKEFPGGIEAYGTDALRFTFCALANTGRDINFSTGRISGYRNFCNKLWNASRYVFMNTEGQDLSNQDVQYSLADRWIQSALQNLIKQVDDAYRKYRFDLLSQYLYEFVWNEYCDWYLEFSKCVLTDKNASDAALRGTRRTLLTVLETLLRLLHPIMPYITEEIWQKAAPLLSIKGDSIMIQPYPELDKQLVDSQAQTDMEGLKQVISAIRTMRSEAGISPAKKIPVIFCKGSQQDQQRIAQADNELKTLARLDNITWQDAITETATAADVVGELDIHIPLAGLIDKDAEMARLQKEIEKLQKDQQKFSKKLQNPNYVNNAPADIVAKEQQRLKEAELSLQKLQAHMQTIASL